MANHSLRTRPSRSRPLLLSKVSQPTTSLLLSKLAGFLTPHFYWPNIQFYWPDLSLLPTSFISPILTFVGQPITPFCQPLTSSGHTLIDLIDQVSQFYRPGCSRSEGLLARSYFIPGGASQRGLAFRVARCQTWTGVRPKIGLKLIKIKQQLSKSAKVNMLKFGDVNFEFGFEW